MLFEDLLYKSADGVVTITINRPDRRNSMRVQTMRELAAAFEMAKQDANCRVVVVTGAGEKAFCAGAEISDFQNKGIVGTRSQYDAYVALSTAIRTIGKPTIAAVNGYALGGGCALTMLLDLTVAVDDARFGLPEVKIGIFPMTVMPILFRTVGRKKALEMIYGGELVSAAEAERIGLVNQVVTRDQFQSSIGAWCERLKKCSPNTLQLGHGAADAMWDMTYDQSLEYGRTIGAIVVLSEDAQEGVTAYLEKREPRWAKL